MPDRTRALVGIHVVAVDDNGERRDLIESVLVAAGARVTTTDWPEEALEVCRTDPPDVVLTVLDFGERRGGAWLLEQVRRRPALRDVRVIALAHQPPALKQPLIPFDGYVVLPIHPEDLRAVVRGVLSDPAR